jgi:AcrR family transcriptional regulator
MNGFERRREEKKRVIREAAFRLFLDIGFDHVTIRQIAKEAHVSHVSIYNFYGSKGELIHELALSILSDVSQRYEALGEKLLPFDGKLRLIWSLKAELLQTRKWEFVFQAAKRSSSIKSAFDAMIATGRQSFYHILEEGKQQGLLKPEIKSESVLLLIDIITFYFEHNDAARPTIAMNSSFIHDLQKSSGSPVQRPG